MLESLMSTTRCTNFGTNVKLRQTKPYFSQLTQKKLHKQVCTYRKVVLELSNLVLHRTLSANESKLIVELLF